MIENNVISNSKCSGITLGKDRKSGHNVWSNDRNKGGAQHYNEVIVRVLADGWAKDKIGSHIIRNNTIFNCEQTGICGTLGAAFSQITNNHIYNIWTKRQFTEAYTIAGGLASVAWTDVLQSVLPLASGMLVFLLGLHRLGGWFCLSCMSFCI